MDNMTSAKPYIIRGLYEWILDNDCTPYVLVDAEFPYVQVPREYVKDGQIVLNIAPRSTGALQITNDELEFNARFGGQARHISVPMGAILFVYAQETGEGMPFPPEKPVAVDDPDQVADAPIVEDKDAKRESENTETKSTLQSVEKVETEQPSKPKLVKKSNRDHLKVIK